MLLTMMRAKLHRATVTRADLHYEGSISIDRDLMDAVGFLPNEQVDVLDIDNGARFTTYVIAAERGSRTIGINGAAARLVQTGDKVIILSYCQLTKPEAEKHQPVVALMDDDNVIKTTKM
jgi:aspartate 1-decarboxylase